MSRSPFKFTKSRGVRKEILEMLDQGIRRREIVSELGCSKEAVDMATKVWKKKRNVDA